APARAAPESSSAAAAIAGRGWGIGGSLTQRAGGQSDGRGGSVMQVQIFGSRLSPFVEKVVRAVALKGLAYKLVDVKSPLDFKRWTPQTGKMRVLDIDGERTYASTLILRLLDARFPEPPLVDADPGVAARQRFIEDWSDEALYWYGMALRWADVNAD